MWAFNTRREDGWWLTPAARVLARLANPWSYVRDWRMLRHLDRMSQRLAEAEADIAEWRLHLLKTCKAVRARKKRESHLYGLPD